nr:MULTISPECIES: hypothetical protein [unclassified Collinsella]
MVLRSMLHYVFEDMPHHVLHVALRIAQIVREDSSIHRGMLFDERGGERIFVRELTVETRASVAATTDDVTRRYLGIRLCSQ